MEDEKICVPLQSQNRKGQQVQITLKEIDNIGAVVQLVRIQACHAWGRGFESRPHRKRLRIIGDVFVLLPICI